MRSIEDIFAKRIEHDCSRCVALCCTATKISSKSPGFNFDKEPFTACDNLREVNGQKLRFQCQIWATTGTPPCEGCLKFECYGSGNIATEIIEKMGLPADHRKPTEMSQTEFEFLTKSRNTLFAVLYSEFRKVVSDKSDQDAMTRFSACYLAMQALLDWVQTAERSGDGIPPELLERTIEANIQLLNAQATR